MSDNWRTDKRKTADRGYGWAWQQARLQHLSENPLCEMCLPRVVQGTVVDHRIPHKGNQTLFWDRSNWQTLCKSHHDGDKQALERSGRIRPQFGIDGEPVQSAQGERNGG